MSDSLINIYLLKGVLHFGAKKQSLGVVKAFSAAVKRLDNGLKRFGRRNKRRFELAEDGQRFQKILENHSGYKDPFCK